MGLLKKSLKVGFIENRDLQAFGFAQFASSGFTRHQIVGLFADAAAHLSAGRFNQRFGVAAAEVGERAREHQGLALQDAVGVSSGLARGLLL